MTTWSRSAPALGSLTLPLAETGADGRPRSRSTATSLPVLREVVEPDAASRWSRATRWRSTGTPCSAPARPWVLVANLPYNVATPLVCDLLDDVPAIERMLVMVQREVGERLAAGPGDDGVRHPVGEGGVLGRRPRSSGGCRRPCSCPSPKVESALRRASCAARPRRSTPTPTRLFALVRAGVRPAPQDAAAVARRGSSSPSVRARPASRPRPGPRSSTSRAGAGSPTRRGEPSGKLAPCLRGSCGLPAALHRGSRPRRHQVEPLPASRGA